jgi:hypothetical protein
MRVSTYRNATGFANPSYPLGLPIRLHAVRQVRERQQDRDGLGHPLKI